MFSNKLKFTLIFAFLTAAIMFSCGKRFEQESEKVASEILYMQCGNVRVLNADTEETQLVADSSAKLYAIAWSPSGKKILFRDHYVKDDTGGLWVSESDGSNLQQVFSMSAYPNMKIHRALWFTDDIIFIDIIDAHTSFFYKLDINTMNLAKMNQNTVPDFTSPQQEFWLQSRIENGERVVEVASFSGTQDSTTKIDYNFYQGVPLAAYSSDGTRFVYPASTSLAGNAGDLWIINVNKKGFSNPRFFANVGKTDEFHWSPDGKVLGILAGKTFNVLDGETGALLKEYPVKNRTSRFWWSPDSKSIITNDITDIWELNIKTGETKSILNAENSVPNCVGDPVDWQLIPMP